MRNFIKIITIAFLLVTTKGYTSTSPQDEVQELKTTIRLSENLIMRFGIVLKSPALRRSPVIAI